MQRQPMQLTLVALLLARVAPAAGASMLRKSIVVPKQDAQIPNPAKNSVSDVIPNAEAPKPEGPKYDHEYVPLSPPAVADMSPTDPIEYTDGWEGVAAHYLDDMDESEGMRFNGATCKSVCAACTIWSAQNNGCFCYATCKMGECGDGVLPHIGWSNNEVSTPKTLWRANCNIGKKNCEAQCMDDDLKDKIKKCGSDKELNPSKCFRQLSEANRPARLDARKNLHYCVKKGLKLCEEFLYSPTEGGWICYEEREACQRVADIGFKIPLQRWTPPPVWKPPTL